MSGAILSLSTNAFPREQLAECLEYTAKLGLQGVELGPWHAEQLAVSPSHLDEARTIFAKLGIRPLSLYAFKGTGVRELDRICEFAAKVSAGLIVVHCRHEEIVENLPQCAEMLHRWSNWCRDRGMILTVENSSFQPLDTFVRLFEAVPQLKLTLDVKHAYKPEKLGLTHEDYLRELGERLANCHISGIDRSREELGDGCPPGRDHVDWTKFAEDLVRRRYTGIVTIELILPTYLSEEDLERAYYDLPPAQPQSPTISHRLALHGTGYFRRVLAPCLAH
ncbi:MAG: sugar phosphate isomerase/epimerase family protein [Kiritimatiellia bacterium]